MASPTCTTRDDVFAAKLNREMVQLQQLDDADREFLQATVGQPRRAHRFAGRAAHRRRLGRPRRRNFKRVMPIDYERVLGVMAQAEADGLDEQADALER